MKKVNRDVLFALVMVAACCVGSAAAAQSVEFLNLPRQWIVAIINHEIWPVSLGCLVLWELWMFGTTKNKLHLVGIMIPLVVLTAWIARDSWLGQIAPGINIH